MLNFHHVAGFPRSHHKCGTIKGGPHAVNAPQIGVYVIHHTDTYQLSRLRQLGCPIARGNHYFGSGNNNLHYTCLTGQV